MRANKNRDGTVGCCQSCLTGDAPLRKSHRDTFKLLLNFAEARCAKASRDMDVADIDDAPRLTLIDAGVSS